MRGVGSRRGRLLSYAPPVDVDLSGRAEHPPGQRVRARARSADRRARARATAHAARRAAAIRACGRGAARRARRGTARRPCASRRTGPPARRTRAAAGAARAPRLRQRRGDGRQQQREHEQERQNSHKLFHLSPSWANVNIDGSAGATQMPACGRGVPRVRATAKAAWHNDSVLRMRVELPVVEIRERKPPWLKVRAPGGPNYLRLKRLMRDANLHSVCEEAHCPNIGECWEDATATFMILGDVCTRNCGYCAIAHGKPAWEDREEPERIGRAVADLALDYVVITSVNRDDLADGGAAHWAATIRAVRRLAPGCRVEALIPDFQGQAASLADVVAARPHVLNHNTETVPRLYKLARHGGRYERTLELFTRARRAAPELPAK